MTLRELVLAVAMFALCSTALARSIEIEVNGLVCAFCAQGIEKTLKKLPATDEVCVSLERRTVAVALKPDQDIADVTLKEAITNAGYSVVGIKRTDESLAAIEARIKGKE